MKSKYWMNHPTLKEGEACVTKDRLCVVFYHKNEFHATYKNHICMGHYASTMNAIKKHVELKMKKYYALKLSEYKAKSEEYWKYLNLIKGV